MGVEWEESSDLTEVASECDVVYQTRIQRERFGERIDLYEEARGKYIVDKGVLNAMQKHAVVMHPLPRLDEVHAMLYCNHNRSTLLQYCYSLTWRLLYTNMT